MNRNKAISTAKTVPNSNPLLTLARSQHQTNLHERRVRTLRHHAEETKLAQKVRFYESFYFKLLGRNSFVLRENFRVSL